MNIKGLSTLEVKSQKEKGLVNRSDFKSSKSVGNILKDNLVTLFNLLITPLLILLFYFKLYQECFSVGIVMVINIAVGIFQEIKAKIALEKISLIDVKKCTVIRDEKETEIEVEEVVEGEYICVKSGEPFIADGQICYARYLEADESMLTGESDYIPKVADDEVMSGSFCVSGNGVYVAKKVGSRSYINKMSEETRKYRKFLSPIQKKVNYLIKFLIFFGIALSLLMSVKYMLELRLEPAVADAKYTVKSISAIIQTMIPQGLVLTVTLIFVFAIFKMSKKHVLVQKPNAIESMAHINIMCMDKTGTLTKNILSLKGFYDERLSENELNKMLSLFAGHSIEKNKTIEAIAKKTGEIKGEASDEIPFTSLKKYSGIRAVYNGKETDFIMGAFETIGEFIKSESDREKLKDDIHALSMKGLRVLVFLYKEAENLPLKSSLYGYNLAALLLLEDEIKEEAEEILKGLQKKNITLKIISGDHPETVKSIALKLNIKGAKNTVTGKELEGLDERAFENAVLDNTIFARVSPRQKLNIIKVLQAKGNYVSMVGDGVNDALAIKEAYLGICMGSGARVTKDVSDIVLIKDTFEIMPEILSQGQKIIQGVKNITKLFLFKNTYAILLITLTQFIDIKFPFTPQQVTMINFITISLPTVFVIGFSDKGSFMDRDYLKDIAVHSLTAGLVTALVTLFVTIISVVWLGNDHMLTKTLVVSTIIILGLFNYLYVTTSPKRAKDLLDKKLITQILLFLIFLPGGVYLSKYMFNYFSLKPLGLKEWAIVLSSSAIGMIGFYFSCKYNVLYRIFKPVKLPGKEG